MEWDWSLTEPVARTSGDYEAEVELLFEPEAGPSGTAAAAACAPPPRPTTSRPAAPVVNNSRLKIERLLAAASSSPASSFVEQTPVAAPVAKSKTPSSAPAKQAEERAVVPALLRAPSRQPAPSSRPKRDRASTSAPPATRKRDDLASLLASLQPSSASNVARDSGRRETSTDRAARPPQTERTSRR